MQRSLEVPDRSQWLGQAAFLLAVLPILFPRSAAAACGVAAAAGLVLSASRLPSGLRRSGSDPAAATALAIVLLGVWGCLSALWSPVPATSATKSAFLVLIAAGSLAAGWAIVTASDRAVARLGKGLLLAVTLGAGLTAVEIVTDQWLTRTILTAVPALRQGLDKHAVVVDGVVKAMSDANLNRRVAVVMLLAWPAVLLAVRGPSGAWRWGSLAAIGAWLLATLLEGRHQSSQVAIVASAITLGLAFLSRRLTILLVGTAWIAAVALAVPIVSMAFRAELHKAEWLFFTARHRIVIWGTTASEVARSPIVGVGADATPVLHKKSLTEKPTVEKAGEFDVAIARHAHNVYLQTWFELGAVGAMLLMAAGVAGLLAIARLQAAVQPFALAHFTTVASVVAFSYGMWQAWFQGAIALGALALVLAVTTARRR